MTAANIGLAHPMRPILPGIATCGQNHQGKQSRRRKAERLAFHEFDLNDAAGFGELLATLRLQSRRDSHGTARRRIGLRLLRYIGA